MSSPVVLGALPPPVRRPAADLGGIRRGSAWMLSGTVSYMVCQWGMVLILARFAPPEALGLFGLALAVTAPIVLFTNLDLRRILATDTLSTVAVSTYVRMRVVTGVVATALIAVAVWLRGYRPEVAAVIIAMGACKSVEAVLDILHGLFQHRGRADIVACSMHLRGPLGVLGLAAGLGLGRTVLGGVVGMGVGWLLVLALYDGPRALHHLRSSAPSRADGSWVDLVTLAWPLGIVALLTSVRGSVPAFIIDARLGLGAVGLFTALAYFHAASNRLVSAVGEAAAPRLAERHAAGDATARRRVMRWMLGTALAISLAGFGAAVAVGAGFLAVCYGPAYADQAPTLVLMMAAVAAANVQTVLDYAMTALRRLRIQPFLYAGGVAVLTVLCVAWVPAYGLAGAALALGCSSLAEAGAAALVLVFAIAPQRRAGGGTA